MKKSFFWPRTSLVCFSALLLAGLFNLQAAFFERGDAVGKSNVLATDAAGPLHGEAAIAHLKQKGTYESLGEAMVATRYSINQIQGTPQSEKKIAYEALNPAHALRAEFTTGGVLVRSSGEQSWQIGLSLKSYGYGQQLVEVPPMVSRQVRGNRIEYKRQKSEVGSQRSDPQLIEWYVNTPGGLEQGFTLSVPPPRESGETTSRGKPLRLVMEWTGDLQGELTQDGQALLLKDAKGQKLATYDHLKAWDATGRELAARMKVSGRELSLEVDDAGAKYPVTIDPTLQVEIKLIAQNGVAKEELGRAVAISGDTAIVGAPRPDSYPNPGAAYIFVRNGPTWTEQAKLVAGGNNGGRDTYFGTAVAISGDLAVIGDTNAYTDDGSFIGRLGAAFVFVRSAGVWSLEKKLLADQKVNNDQFGFSVAISGGTVIVGAPWDDFSLPVTAQRGAAYAFARNGGSWSQQAKLIPADGVAGDLFGWSVGVSGNNAIVGAPNRFDRDGAAYIFVRGDTGWVEEDTLTGDNAVPGEGFANSVAISENTAIAGVLHDVSRNSTLGAAYVFVRNGTTWPRQQKLVGDSAADWFFGYSVAISNDQAVVGDPLDDQTNIQVPGAAYLFSRTNGTWSRMRRLTASDGAVSDGFGFSVGINIYGESVVGAPGHDVGANTNQGQGYLFDSPHDTDGDGLPDAWEINGVTIDGVFINLKAMGANPKHKDIFIHVDRMQAGPAGVVFEPDPEAIKLATAAFLMAPVDNPDGKQGITLHVDFGPTAIMNPLTEETWGTLSKSGEVPYQEVLASDNTIVSARQALAPIKLIHFDPAKRNAVFHYALYCNDEGPPHNGGFSLGQPASDFVVARVAGSTPGKKLMRGALVFMHELGHNLGLGHGGGDEVGFKPNYISIMNYRFQILGMLNPNGRQRYLDFSRRTLDTLNENNLDEIAGINDPEGHLTLWNPLTRHDEPPGNNACVENPDSYYRLFYPTKALDWSCDGTGNSTSVAADINKDGRCVSSGPDGLLKTVPQGDDVVMGPFITTGPNRICETTAAKPCAASGADPKDCDKQEQDPGFEEDVFLVGFNDWPALVFTGDDGAIGRTQASKAGRTTTNSLQNGTLPKELTREELEAEVPPALLAEEEVAPLDVVTRSPMSGGAPLTVNFNGTGSTAVTGTIVKWEWDFGDSTIGTGATVAHTYTSPGDYFASLTVTDSNGRVNLIPQHYLVTVAGSAPTNAPNLTPYQPSGWSNKIVVSKTTGTNTDSGPLLPTDTLYVDWAVANDGDVATATAFSTKLYVDGVEKQNLNTSPPMNPSAVIGVQDFNIGSLSAGQHTIRIFTDATQVITEKKETDNAYTRTIVIKSLSTPTPTPTVSPTPSGSPTPPATPTPSGTPTPTPTPVPGAPLPGRRITNVADSTQFPYVSFYTYGINNDRTLVLHATLPNSPTVLFTKTATGPFITIAEQGTLAVPQFDGAPRINASGNVAFATRRGVGGEGNARVLVGNGGPFTVIATDDPAGKFKLFNNSSTPINDSGTVAFYAYGNTTPGRNNDGIYSGNGGAVTTISANLPGENAVAHGSYPAINADGTVAFWEIAGATTGIYKVAPGGLRTTISETTLNWPRYGQGFSINSSGTVAFTSTLENSVERVYTGNGGALTTVAEAAGQSNTTPFRYLLGPAAINDAGMVAFLAILSDNRKGIFAGPNIIAGQIQPTIPDKIIAEGDALFGSTVDNLLYVSALNEKGDVAFSYELKNRVTGVAFASALPTVLANVSTRLPVRTGDDVLIGGFIVTGTEPKKVIVRAIGPSLGLADQLANPTLELYSGSTLLESNDNWVDSPNKQAIIDSTIPPANNLESAIIRTLPANGTGYTAVVRGANGGQGIAVVEAYDLDRIADSTLANISTRGLVQTGDNVLIAGTIVLGQAPQKVIVRAIGPSLNIAGKLADPTLELRDANGGLIRANDNWRTGGQETEIIQSTVPPANDSESALVATLSAGGAAFTAIVRGVGDTTGIAVVEVYALQ